MGVTSPGTMTVSVNLQSSKPAFYEESSPIKLLRLLRWEGCKSSADKEMQTWNRTAEPDVPGMPAKPSIQGRSPSNAS